jgi:hypothetical protein
MQSVLATTPCIVIRQRVAARGGVLVALLYHEIAWRSKRGGAVLPTISYKTVYYDQ